MSGTAEPAPVADAHTHLFNASDLPVANFVKHVILYCALGASGVARAARSD